jgi:RecJ-like exonuclease
MRIEKVIRGNRRLGYRVQGKGKLYDKKKDAKQAIELNGHKCEPGTIKVYVKQRGDRMTEFSYQNPGAIVSCPACESETEIEVYLNFNTCEGGDELLVTAAAGCESCGAIFAEKRQRIKKG